MRRRWGTDRSVGIWDEIRVRLTTDPWGTYRLVGLSLSMSCENGLTRGDLHTKLARDDYCVARPPDHTKSASPRTNFVPSSPSNPFFSHSPYTFSYSL